MKQGRQGELTSTTKITNTEGFAGHTVIMCFIVNRIIADINTRLACFVVECKMQNKNNDNEEMW